jgi:NADPH:quinone reductase-like Zn-dependent oxidoreductase
VAPALDSSQESSASENGVGAAASSANATATMRQIVKEEYGRPTVLKLRTVAKPVPEENQVLVRVLASSVNPSEWYDVTGIFMTRIGNGLRRPKVPTVGTDLAGVIEAVGSEVTDFRPGDEVFGTSGSSWAEYTCARHDRVVRKPANVSFTDAAAVPVAGLTALQALRNKGNVQPGQKVLINGASGGVGTFAVQLAKHFGAEVTAVCRTHNVELIRSLGADHVVDYTREDFTTLPTRHDLMLDIAGSRPFRQFRRVLTPQATVVIVGGRMTYRGVGPLPHLAGTLLASLVRSQKATFFVAQVKKEDLSFLGDLLESGELRPAIDRTFPLDQTAKALAYLGEGHARAKVVLTI